MKVAALLAMLAALPGHASEAVTPAQARSNVVAALPPEIARGAGQGDLQAYLQKLGPEQKQAAIRSLTAKEGELGNDPTTLGVIGEAYIALGKVKEARQVADAAMRQNPNSPDARRLNGLVTAQERLAPREGGAGPATGGGGTAAGRVAPAAAGSQTPLNALERRIQGVFRRGNNSEEFRSTLEDAQGYSVAELKKAGIQFKSAEPDQRDAVQITKTQTDEGDKFVISIRDDALNSRGDTEARGAAQVANGVRQAQTKRDHPYIGGALIMARGWISGGRTHRELAPNDVDSRPTSPSDQNLMVARKLVDRENYQFNPETESYGGGTTSMALGLLNGKSTNQKLSLEDLFSYFLMSTGRAKAD